MAFWGCRISLQRCWQRIVMPRRDTGQVLQPSWTSAPGIAPTLRQHSQFAIRECRMGVMVLKPQDVYVALKIVASNADRAPYSQLAAELVMSPSEWAERARRRRVPSREAGGARRSPQPSAAFRAFRVRGLRAVLRRACVSRSRVPRVRNLATVRVDSAGQATHEILASTPGGFC